MDNVAQRRREAGLYDPATGTDRWDFQGSSSCGRGRPPRVSCRFRFLSWQVAVRSVSVCSGERHSRSVLAGHYVIR